MISVKCDGVQRLDRALSNYASTLSGPGRSELLSSVAAEVESQTRQRIESERESPDGRPWREWSAAYAKTRHANHALLQNTGHMLDSIVHDVQSHEAAVGTGMEYAARQHAMRPFLGVSRDNLAELERVLANFADRFSGGED